MIKTQFGNEIEVTGFDPETQLVRALRKVDGKIRIFPMWSLKADGGVEEIQKACAFAKQEPLDMTLDV